RRRGGRSGWLRLEQSARLSRHSLQRRPRVRTLGGGSAWRGTRRAIDPADHRQDLLGDVRDVHRADLPVRDWPAAVDDIILGSPVNSEIDRGDTVAIQADAAKRVTETIKEAARIL